MNAATVAIHVAASFHLGDDLGAIFDNFRMVGEGSRKASNLCFPCRPIEGGWDRSFEVGFGLLMREVGGLVLGGHFYAHIGLPLTEFFHGIPIVALGLLPERDFQGSRVVLQRHIYALESV